MPKTEDEEKEMKTDRVSKPILEPAKLIKPDPIQALAKQQQLFQESVQKNIEALQQQQKAQFAMMQKSMEQFMLLNVAKPPPPDLNSNIEEKITGTKPKALKATESKAQAVNDIETDSDSDVSDIIKYRRKRLLSLDADVRGLKSSLYELPEFDGEPTKWPKFIASYKNSVEYAKFNNVENMMRLLKYVKGDALRMIQAR